MATSLWLHCYGFMFHRGHHAATVPLCSVTTQHAHDLFRGADATAAAAVEVAAIRCKAAMTTLLPRMAALRSAASAAEAAAAEALLEEQLLSFVGPEYVHALLSCSQVRACAFHFESLFCHAPEPLFCSRARQVRARVSHLFRRAFGVRRPQACARAGAVSLNCEGW